MTPAMLCLISLLATFAIASPIHEIIARQNSDLPRLVIYYQSSHDANGNPVSMLPLITEQGISLTHIIISSFHMDSNSVIHLNDAPPSDPKFATIWNETAVLKNAGVKIMGMIGGAAPGSYDNTTLDGDDATFAEYYGQVKDLVTTYGLQGLDLDVEQPMSQAGITRLVDSLYQDFGSDFIITLAPVAAALDNGGNLSGFDYKQLESTDGDKIAFYNAQFYNGWGELTDSNQFDQIVENGFSPQKVMAGEITSPDNGNGFIPYEQLNTTIIQLRNAYGEIGGIMGWEYFNSAPDGSSEPWVWAQEMTAVLRPNQPVNLTITPATASALADAWKSSVVGNTPTVEQGSVEPTPNVDYMAMVNA
ncbi:hypothetical protein G7Y89_g4242 [Cudoniella acicularis]|uniref:GH18 domain-containing protein n=1 Tax=Cudoniella acicularis TaxID=354080 RepID=A0A8H4RR97_9HELO|nr:hypothetical protein G7Y89_g4242 [Cudoniella acicularis]